MNIIICHTAERDRTLVLVNGMVAMDSRETLLMDEHDLVDSFRRLGYDVTIANLPPMAEVN